MEGLCKNFVHGDFFCHNLVWDSEKKRMIVIDWQNYGMGNRGDISFFMNIGTSWGMDVKRDEFIDRYIHKRKTYSDMTFTRKELELEFAINDLVTNYIHWWEYLQDGPAERVDGVYSRMIEAYKMVREVL